MEKIKTVFSLSKPNRLVFMAPGDKAPDTNVDPTDKAGEKDLKDIPLKDKLELAKKHITKVVEGLTDEEHAKAMGKIEGWLKENPEASTINFKEYIKVVELEAARQIMIANNKKEEEKKDAEKDAENLEKAKALIKSEPDPEDPRIVVIRIKNMTPFRVASDVSDEIIKEFTPKVKTMIVDGGFKDTELPGSIEQGLRNDLNYIVKEKEGKSEMRKAVDRDNLAEYQKTKAKEAEIDARNSAARTDRADKDPVIKETVEGISDTFTIGPFSRTSRNGRERSRDSIRLAITGEKMTIETKIIQEFSRELKDTGVARSTADAIKEWVEKEVASHGKELMEGKAVTLDFSKAKKELFVIALENKAKADARVAAVEKPAQAEAKTEVESAPVVAEVAVEKPAQAVEKAKTEVVAEPAQVEKAVVETKKEEPVVATGGEKVAGEPAQVVAEVAVEKPVKTEKKSGTYDEKFAQREAEKLADPLAILEASSRMDDMKKIINGHKSYKLGDWKAINNELASLVVADMDDKTLTDEKAISIVTTLQKQLSEKEGVSIGETDGKAGPKTLKALAKYLEIDAKKVRSSGKGGDEKDKKATAQVSEESPKEEFYALSLENEALSNVLNSRMTTLLASYNKAYPAFNIEEAEGSEREFFKKVVNGKDAETYVATDVKIKNTDYTFQIRVNTVNDNILVSEKGTPTIRQLNGNSDLAKYVKKIRNSFSKGREIFDDVTLPDQLAQPTESVPQGVEPIAQERDMSESKDVPSEEDYVIATDSDGKQYFTTADGKEVFGGKKFDYIGGFREGYADVVEGEKYYFIDAKGEKAFGGKSFDYTDMFFEGYASVEEGEKWYFIDTKGNKAFGGKEFDDAGRFDEGYADVKEGKEWYFIDTKGEEYTKDADGKMVPVAKPQTEKGDKEPEWHAPIATENQPQEELNPFDVMSSEDKTQSVPREVVPPSQDENIMGDPTPTVEIAKEDSQKGSSTKQYDIPEGRNSIV